MSQIIDHDDYPLSPLRYEKQSAINLTGIEGVLDFDGVRNPTGLSAMAHRMLIPYRTAADDYQLRVGATESAAEAAVAYEALIDPKVWDVKFQPRTIRYVDHQGIDRKHTFDLRIDFKMGRSRLVYVRNEHSLLKPWTQSAIALIRGALPPEDARLMAVVNASDYSRARRDNLERMYLMTLQPCPEQDEAVLTHARQLSTLYRMKDLRAGLRLEPWQIFQSCLRLIARKDLLADLDAVISHQSRLEVAA